MDADDDLYGDLAGLAQGADERRAAEQQVRAERPPQHRRGA